MKFEKTEKGQEAFKARSELLTVRQRSAFLLVDGIKSVEQILKMTAALGITQLDVDALAEYGFVRQVHSTGVPAANIPTSSAATLAAVLNPAPQPPATPPLPASTASALAVDPAQPSLATEQERFAKAWPLATQLTAGLGLRGFRLNLAIEKASGYDDLLKLMPKIQDAVGTEKCTAFMRALSGK